MLDGVFVKEISSRNGAKNQLVISYFKSDKTYLEAFKKHLATLIRRNSVETWDNTNLEAGQDWDATIRKKLSTANIIVFLVSADLIQDEYNWNVEMKEALKRHKQGTATIIPVIVRKCNWEDTPLGQFAALPDKDNPVSAWSNEDEAWTQVVAKIEAVLTERRLA